MAVPLRPLLAYHGEMPPTLAPESIEDLARALRECRDKKQAVELGGNFTKRAMGGPVAPPDAVVSTNRLNQILAYEPKDLTVSVGAGMPFRDLQQALAVNGQMLPLDPPFSEQATVGGVLATNGSGPRRRRYGTARDMVIGMQMVTIDGNIVKSGGMVVKNVTGLDIAKLMIGSFGTLAAIASANFKVFPKPDAERTFVFASGSLDSILSLRQAIIGGVLQPTAIDILNHDAAVAAGGDPPPGYLLVTTVEGNRAAVERYESEYGKLAQRCRVETFVPLAEINAVEVWEAIRNLTPRAVGSNGLVVRLSAKASQLRDLFDAPLAKNGPVPVVARGGVSVGHVYCPSLEVARRTMERAHTAGLRGVIEYAKRDKDGLALWPHPGDELALMQRIKDSLDPEHLLNRGRLFGRI